MKELECELPRRDVLRASERLAAHLQPRSGKRAARARIESSNRQCAAACGVYIGSLAAELSLTNRLEEGSTTGDFGDLYPKCSWSRDIVQVGTNGLFQADFTVVDMSAGQPVESRLSVMLYRPDSIVGAGAPLRR